MSARRLLVAALLALLWIGPGGGHSAGAAANEPLLFLGIQRHTAIDSVVSQQLSEYLSEHGENLLKPVTLSDAERRCRHPQCMEALAADNHVGLILSGDVSSAGPNNTLRVQARLYDVRRRGTEEAYTEMENLCADCDETKLGILLSTTTTGLLARYRSLSPSQPLPAAPALPPAPVPAGPGAAYAPAVPSGLAAPPFGPPPAAPPPQAGAGGLTGPGAGSAGPGVSPLPPPPYLPEAYGNAPRPEAVPGAAASAPPRRRTMSKTRKAVAAVFGVLGFGSLAVAAIMTGLDRRIATDYSYNPTGTACSAQENIGKACVFSTVGVYAPLYAVGGLLAGGMILTLALPESRPRPTSQEAAN